ncbi:MAG TPA: hypothetical protein VGM12_15130 [Trebonia sp.]
MLDSGSRYLDVAVGPGGERSPCGRRVPRYPEVAVGSGVARPGPVETAALGTAALGRGPPGVNAADDDGDAVGAAVGGAPVLTAVLTGDAVLAGDAEPTGALTGVGTALGACVRGVGVALSGEGEASGESRD